MVKMRVGQFDILHIFLTLDLTKDVYVFGRDVNLADVCFAQTAFHASVFFRLSKKHFELIKVIF
jgi:ABC-type uncharacterized transport system permease subunit